MPLLVEVTEGPALLRLLQALPVVSSLGLPEVRETTATLALLEQVFGLRTPVARPPLGVPTPRRPLLAASTSPTPAASLAPPQGSLVLLLVGNDFSQVFDFTERPNGRR